MRIEKRGDEEWLVDVDVDMSDCEERSPDVRGLICTRHFNGEHIAGGNYAHDGAIHIMARWPMSAELAEGIERAAENRRTQCMIDAIHVINTATFAAGVEPPEDAPEQVGVLYRWTRSAGSGGLRLRDYQRYGISSRFVAKALECGALVVRIEEER